MSVVVRGEFKGSKMIYIYENKEDADKAAAGERIFPLFSCGIKKASVIMAHLRPMLDFVMDEGELPADFTKSLEKLAKYSEEGGK